MQKYFHTLNEPYYTVTTPNVASVHLHNLGQDDVPYYYNVALKASDLGGHSTGSS